MYQCYHHQNRSSWACETKDRKHFHCFCCNATGSNDCSDDYFIDVLVFRTESQLLTADFDYGDEIYSLDDMNSSSEKTSEIEKLRTLFKSCKQNGHLPLTCLAEKYQDPDTTKCHCHSGSGRDQSSDQTSFNTSEIWGAYPCRVTQDRAILMHSQSKNMNLTIALFFFIVLFLILIIIFLILKFRKKFCNKNESTIARNLLTD